MPTASQVQDIAIEPKVLKVLVIGYVWPEPTSSAAGGRMLGLLRLFKNQGWHITFASPAADSPYTIDFEALAVQKVHIELNSPSFDTFVRASSPDMVLFDRFMMEEQFGWRVAENCPKAIRIIDTVDLHFLRYARQAALKANREVSIKDLYSDTAKREIASILRSDVSLIISEYEMELLTNTFKLDPSILYYLPLLVEPIDETRTSSWLSFEERKDFVFIGNFLHEPNWDAVRFLKESIWPLIRKALPQAELKVYGAYPPQKALEMHKPKEGFHVMGRAEDADAVVSRARVCLAPLRFGAGVKGKLAEAMQCGTPSVTTRIGAEGMSGTLPWNGSIADTAEEIAMFSVKLYTQKEDWEKAQQNGIQLINTRNAAYLFNPSLVKHLCKVFETLEEHREANFLGSVLQHHTLHSTKYMARWIEAKNQKG